VLLLVLMTNAVIYASSSVLFSSGVFVHVMEIRYRDSFASIFSVGFILRKKRSAARFAESESLTESLTNIKNRFVVIAMAWVRTSMILNVDVHRPLAMASHPKAFIGLC
jgi:hypothetical protein